MVTSFALSSLKRRLKTELITQRLRYIRWRHPFDGSDFARFLSRLGIQPGSVVLVHGSLNGFEGFSGPPREIVSILQQTVGPEGTLMMPTLPFTGLASDWADGHPIFDVRRTPSQMGLMTEIFRRLPGVERSLHPTHSVAAWGRLAREITQDHHLCQTPCGRHSPYGRLLDHGGMNLMLGVDIRAMTFYHTVEEILEAEMDPSPFTTRTWRLHSRDAQGHLLPTETRLFNPQLSKRRDLRLLIPELKKSRAFHQERVSLLEGIRLNAGDVLEVLTSMAKEGRYCYHPEAGYKTL